MKYIGLILITIGIAFVGFACFRYFQSKSDIISPLPDQQGVKVIQITPSK